MRKPLRLLLIFLMLLSAGGLLGLYSYRAALWPHGDDLASAKSRLAPHLSLYTPNGQGPFATVLVFHGCSGQSPGFVENVKNWLLPAGYALLFVDSLSARGVTDWHPVCDGKQLWGNERALDVYAAIELAAALPNVDGRRLALLGYSHGGWTILDALAYGGDSGHGFSAPGNTALQRVRAAVTFYPYCGFPARLRQGLGRELPLLMLLAGQDHITDHRQCLSALAGLDLDEVQVVRYAQAGHVFDQRSDLNTYQPPLAIAAQRQATAFLRDKLGPTQ